MCTNIDLLGFCRGDGECGDQQALCQEAADAMEPTRGSSAPADADQDLGWLATSYIRALVSRHDERQRQGSESSSRLTAPHFLMLSPRPERRSRLNRSNPFASSIFFKASPDDAARALGSSLNVCFKMMMWRAAISPLTRLALMHRTTSCGVSHAVSRSWCSRTVRMPSLSGGAKHVTRVQNLTAANTMSCSRQSAVLALWRFSKHHHAVTARCACWHGRC